MSFNSLEFPLYFTAVVMIYYALPHRARWGLLLIASYVFYMSWQPAYALLLAFSTLIDYLAALRIAAARSRRSRRGWLALSLIGNLGVLGAFKYAAPIGEAANAALRGAGLTFQVPEAGWLLPIGISFFTFQTLGYTIDVYRGQRAPERNLGFFALYVSFFPQLVAGPIERASHLLPQLRETRSFDAERVVSGLRRMLWGFFKKLVIADRLAIFVQRAYEAPGEASGVLLLLTAYAFLFQLYCDFSGYTDIAIGAARVLNVDLQENFRAPFLARNPGEIWQRWHVTLTDWFRSYVFLPFLRAYARRGRVAQMGGFLLFSALIGLWHGPSWTFVAWGALIGGAQVVFSVTRDARAYLVRASGLAARPHLHVVWQVLVTFHLMVFAGVLFRAESIEQAGTIVSRIARGATGTLGVSDVYPTYESAIALASVALLMAVDVLQERNETPQDIARLPIVLRWASAYGLLFGTLTFGVFGLEEFVYFQF